MSALDFNLPTNFKPPVLLPSDITSLVISDLSDDPTSLLNLSLVSRSWLYPTRRLLFSTITIKLHRSKGPCQRAGSADTNSDDNRSDFSKCDSLVHFANEFPHKLAGFVRKLVVTTRAVQSQESHCQVVQGGEDGEDEESGETYAHVELDFLKAALHRLPALHALHLSSCLLGDSLASSRPVLNDTDATIPIQSGLTQDLMAPYPLRELALSGVRADVETFRSLFSRLKIREKVSVIETPVIPLGDDEENSEGEDKFVDEFNDGDDDGEDKMDSNPVPAFRTHRSFTGLRSLTITPRRDGCFYFGLPTVYTTLLNAPTGLTTLDAGSLFTGDEYYWGMKHLIRDRGRQLLRLRMEIYWDYTYDLEDHLRYWDHFDEHCPSLQVLHIFVHSNVFVNYSAPSPTRQNDSRPLRAARRIISKANTSSLREVILGFDLGIPPPTNGSADITDFVPGEDDDMSIREEIFSEMHELDETFVRMGGLESVGIQDESGSTGELSAWVSREPPRCFKDFVAEILVKTRERGILYFKGDEAFLPESRAPNRARAVDG